VEEVGMKHRFALLVAALTSAVTVTAVALAAASPSVVTGSHSNVTHSSAVLRGTVNPNGSGTSYFFQWGLTSGYGVNGRLHWAGGGTTAVAVRATAAGLIPGTVYHYRVVATNKFGIAVGADRTFKTGGFPPPGVETGSPAQVGRSFVTLTGVINPNGATTTWVFQYGTSVAYGIQTFGGAVAGASAPIIVSQPVQGLASGTIFHYRLIALHGSSIVSYGADQIFMTEPSSRPRPRVRARTAPRRERHKPFVFTTSGSVAGPSWIPAAFACAGNVRIRFLLGRRAVAVGLVPVQPNCAFSGQTVFRRLPGRGPRHRQVRLLVRIRFQGNGYLAPARARPRNVLLG
jgi:hypothetical protein